MEPALVLHLVSRRTAEPRDGWVSADGSIRHEVVTWRRRPRNLRSAALVVAHGIPALIVSQSLLEGGPPLVFRAGRSRRRSSRLSRNLHANWIAAPDTRTGRAVAARFGLFENNVSIIQDDDPEVWDAFAVMLLGRGWTPSDDYLPSSTTHRRVRWPGLASRTILRARPPRPARAEPRTRVRTRRSRPPTAATDLRDPTPVEDTPDTKVAPRAAARSGIASGAMPVGPPEAEPRSESGTGIDLLADPASAAPDSAPAARGNRAGDALFGGDTTSQAFEAATTRREQAPERVPDPPAAGTGTERRPNGVEPHEIAPPRRVPVGIVDPSVPGRAWWMYRQMGTAPPAAAPPGARPPGDGDGDGDGPRAGPDPGDAGAAPSRLEIVQTSLRSGVGFFVLGMIALGVVVLCAQVGATREGPFLVPVAALLLSVAAARRMARVHPAEPWIGRWLIIGTVAKIAASYLRYYNLVVTYNGQGDATGYDQYGREFAHAWATGGKVPVLSNLRETNFIRWFTGVVYYVFGSNLLTGTFVFGLLALLGSYFWYRATVDAVPIVNPRMYLALVLFAPSILFWPALVGKEALMQFGLGVVALGASYLLRQHLLTGLLITLSGGWLLWVVRPHLLALVAVGAGAAYLAGRVRREGRRAGLLSRPLGIIVVAFLVAFAIGQGAKFLGINALSPSSIQGELDQQTTRSDQGGSHFNNGNNSLNPIYLPRDAVTVLVRPFPWEAGGGLQILAALEGTALGFLLVWRFASLRVALSRSREAPFLMLCWVLTALYAIAFASFANFGLLVRQRSLVLPAVFVLVAVDPALDRRRRARISSITSGSSDSEPPGDTRVIEAAARDR